MRGVALGGVRRSLGAGKGVAALDRGSDPRYEKAMRARPHRGALLASLLVAACGSTGLVEVFSQGPAGGAADGGLANSAVGDGGDAAIDEKKDGGGGRDGGKRDGGGSSVDSGAVEASTVDAGPTDPGIACGSGSTGRKYCDPAQVCCVTNVFAATPTYACKSQASSCSGLVTTCGDSTDCAGKICCGTFNTVSGTYDSVKCQTTCDVNSTLLIEYRLCDPAAAVDECVAHGLQCLPSSAVAGLYVCKS